MTYRHQYEGAEHIGLVLKAARANLRFAQPAQADELIQEGLETVLKCEKKFDASRGFAFSTYAYRAIGLKVRQYQQRDTAVYSSHRVSPDKTTRCYRSQAISGDTNSRGRAENGEGIESIIAAAPAPETPPEDVLDSRRRLKAVKKAMKALDPVERALILRNVLGDETLKIIAKDVPLSPERLRQKRNEAIAKLRDALPYQE